MSRGGGEENMLDKDKEIEGGGSTNRNREPLPEHKFVLFR